MSKHIRMDERSPERERPSMTSEIRVGEGVQNDSPKYDVIVGQKLLDMVGRGPRGVENHQKWSDVIYGRSQTNLKNLDYSSKF